MKNKDIIEELFKKIAFELQSWYVDEGEYQPTFEQAERQSKKYIKEVLKSQRAEIEKDFGKGKPHNFCPSCKMLVPCKHWDCHREMLEKQRTDIMAEVRGKIDKIIWESKEKDSDRE